MARAAKKETPLTTEEKLAKALVPDEEQPYPVPENWCWVRIGDITVRVKRGKAPKYVEKSDFPVFAQKCNQKDGTIALKKAQFLNPDMITKISDDDFLHNSDIVINSTGTGTLGRVGFFNEHDRLGYKKILPDSHITVVRCSSITHPYFLYLFLKGKQDYLELQGAGSTNQKELKPITISQIPIPLPPLPEQQRIVTLIESLFADLDAAKEKLQTVLDGFAKRRAALLHQAFTGELTREWREENEVGLESWGKKPLCEVTENHDSKRIPLSQKERENLNRKYDYYGASGIIDKVDRYIFDGKYLLIGEDGANLITRSKPIAFIAEGQYWVNNHAHVLSMSPSIIMDFLCYHINSIDLVPYVTGSAQPKMTQTKMNKIPIPLPTLAEQKEIVHILDEVFAKESQSKAAVESALAEIETMKKAILATAFRGGLGTGNESDGTAVHLLKDAMKSH